MYILRAEIAMKAVYSEIVVDGYNLIHKLYPSPTSTSLDALRQETERRLLRFQRNTPYPVTIVYDGKGGQRECAFGVPLHVVYTPTSKSADLWIIDYVKSLNPKVKMVTIVSLDDEIRRYAAAFGAKCVKSEVFALQLKRTESAEPQQGKRTGDKHLSFKEKKFNEQLLTDQEVDRWMQLFNRNKS